jgi:uncharacterized membrane protein YdfJ with MMPL/SSD domain
MGIAHLQRRRAMHFPLIGPHADWHAIVTGLSMVIFAGLTIINMIWGFSVNDMSALKTSHYSAALILLTWVFGIWALGLVFLYFFGKSILMAWGDQLPSFSRSDDSHSSDDPSSNH